MTAAPRLDLSRFLPYRLSVLSNTMSESIAAAYRRDFGLSVAQWRVLCVLQQEAGLSATAVSERTAMDKVAVSRAVSGLIENGRVERRATPEDGRSSALHLTTAGEKIYHEVAPMAVAFEDTLLKALSEEERQQFSSLLTKLAEAASPDRPLW